jgi:chromosome partitioning protein
VESLVVTTVVSFISEKGGVGKTTACYHIAVALNRFHRKSVLVIDADYQRGGITGRFFPHLIENFTNGSIEGQTLFHKYQQLYSASPMTPDVTILHAPWRAFIYVLDPVGGRRLRSSHVLTMFHKARKEDTTATHDMLQNLMWIT